MHRVSRPAHVRPAAGVPTAGSRTKGQWRRSRTARTPTRDAQRGPDEEPVGDEHRGEDTEAASGTPPPPPLHGLLNSLPYRHRTMGVLCIIGALTLLVINGWFHLDSGWDPAMGPA